MKRMMTLAAGVCLMAGFAVAQNGIGHPPTVVAPKFTLKKVVDGPNPIENPSGTITRFGFLNDFPPRPIEATKTEPDENTYLGV